jgi:hypothetical protein
MEAAEQWEPDDTRVSRLVLRERGGEIPPHHSSRRLDRRRATLALARRRSEWLRSRCPGPGRRDSRAAQQLMRRLLKSAVTSPRVMITDKLRSYGAARAKMGLRRTSPAQGPEQSRGELSPADKATRTDHEAIQISPPGTTFSVGSRSRREPLPHPLSRICHG